MEFEAGLTSEAFQEQYFLWDRGAFVGEDFDLFNFHMQNNLYRTLNLVSEYFSQVDTSKVHFVVLGKKF